MSYMAQNLVTSSAFELKDGKVPGSHSVEHLQPVVLRVLDEVVVQRRLLVPTRKIGRTTYTLKISFIVFQLESVKIFGKDRQSYR